MKTPSLELHELIHSLKPSEKRYFKLDASKHNSGKKNKYLSLFEAVEKQEEYNETELLIFFKNESFSNNFSVIKRYLYDMILKSLTNYHADISVTSQINEWLKQIEILYYKRLYKHGLKLLKKAKMLAEKHEKHLLLLEIIGWEMLTYRYKGSSEGLNFKLKGLFDDELRYLSNYENYRKGRKASSIARAISGNTLLMRDNQTFVEINNLEKDLELLSQRHATLSNNTLFHYYNAKGTCLQIKGNYEESYESFDQLVSLMELHPHFIVDNPIIYINAIFNLINKSGFLKKYDEVMCLVEKIEEATQNNPIFLKHELVKSMLLNLYSVKIEVHYETGEFEKGLEEMAKTETESNDLKKVLPDSRNIFHLQFSKLYFGVGDYTNSLKWLNKLLNDLETQFNPELQSYSRIFQLIVLFELKKIDLIEYMAKQAFLYLSKYKRLYQLETTLLNFFEKTVPKINGKKEWLTSFKNLRKDVVLITENPLERKALEYFDYIAWLDSKVTSKPFADAVKERNIAK